MPIARFPKPVAEYVAAFGLVAIALTRDGRLVVTRDPEGAAQAWWCAADQAGAVVKRAKANGGDVVAAAQALNVTMTEHRVVLERVGVAVQRLEEKIEFLRRTGGLQKFNEAYRAHRIAAQVAGRSFMPYNTALARLRAALAGAAAGGQSPDFVKVLDG